MKKVVRQVVLLSLMTIVILIMAATSQGVSAIDSNGTNLADWEYTETDDTIILTKYIETSTDVVIPGSFTVDDSLKKVKLNSLQKETSVFKKCKDDSGFISITSLQIGTPEQKVSVVDEDLSQAFSFWRNLTSIDIRGLDTSQVTNMSKMFYACVNLTSLDVSSLDTSNVTDMNTMFSDCSSLTSLDVSHFDTSRVKITGYMFKGCSHLTSLDVSNFKTENVSKMECMFSGCSSLTSLDVSHFDTNKLQYLDFMFEDCNNLTSLNVSGFKLKQHIALRLEGMFRNCMHLHYFDLDGWNFIGNDNITYYKMFEVSNATTDTPTVIKCSNEDEDKLKEMCLHTSLNVINNRKVSEYPKYIANGGIYEDGSTEKHCFDSIVVNESKIPITQKEVCEYFDAPKKVDKIFDGWYLESECKTKYISDNTPIDMNEVIKEGLTLYAGWRDTEHTVSYQFVSGTDGKDLPIEVIGLLPTETTVVDGNKVTPTAPAQTVVSVTGGSWKFVEYDATEKIATEDMTFTGTWIYNSAPTITASDRTITAGDAFDPMEGVSGTDKEDGNLTDSIQIISNNVNANREGTYQITYQVTDSEGITVTKIIYVTVNKKDEPVTPKPSEDDNKPTVTVDTDDYHNKVVENKVQTSDNTDIMMWFVLIIISNGCIVWMNRKRNIN